ncbi:hypothetical protein [Sphingobium boeckii]|uniref:Uncharacterized protein n=1 Tax=Sphingobium boeckii TaxID=1082345 RepID=A0A7W9AID4_9SPHN|nr:hypothetical protein [Sphingobium boeckii]MBB5686128.1 hypothetical protein [Sphingobium boeckii]
MMRSVLFGGIAAIGVPAVVKTLKSEGLQILAAGSMDVDVGHGVTLHWSWPVFVVVTGLVFILLQTTHGRN